jgi:hypothetical protein
MQLSKDMSTQQPAVGGQKRSRAAARFEATNPYSPSGRQNKISRPPPSLDIETPIKKLRLADDSTRFEGFLDLRRRLQRCVLKQDHVSEILFYLQDPIENNIAGT